MEINLHEYEIMTNKIILADGLTRTGKAMLNNLLSGFENISSIQFINVLEQLLPLYEHKKMDRDAISAYLRLYLNENFYNYKLSRNLNFRYDDLTSIHNTKNPREFFQNLSKCDGDTVVDELNKKDLYFQFQTHDLLTHFSSFLELGIDVLVVELFRNPIDTIHSWYKRGWGTRFDSADPRSGTTLFKYKDRIIPHYAVGVEEEYLNLNEMEKCIFLHNRLLKKSIKEYKKLTDVQKNKFILLKYEEMLTDTDNQLNRISNFLNLKRSSYMNIAMKDARVPRILNSSDRTRKFEEIQSKSQKKYLDDLTILTDNYNNNFYGLNE